MDDKPSREELKRRIREKTNPRNRSSAGKSAVPTSKKEAQNVDLSSLMMGAGIDDPEMLKELMASNGNPKALLGKLSTLMANMPKEPNGPPIEDDDDEAVPTII